MGDGDPRARVAVTVGCSARIESMVEPFIMAGPSLSQSETDVVRKG